MTPRDATRVMEFVHDPETITKAEELLGPLLEENDCDTNFFSWCVLQGKMEVRAIRYEGIPVAAVWFRVEGVKLVISMLKSVVNYKLPYDLGDKAFVALAKSRGCTIIEGKTRRRAHMKQLEQLGYTAESINVVKRL